MVETNERWDNNSENYKKKKLEEDNFESEDENSLEVSNISSSNNLSKQIDFN